VSESSLIARPIVGVSASDGTQPLWYRILKLFLPGFFFGRHGPSTGRVCTTEGMSSEGGVSTEQTFVAEPSNIPTSPGDTPTVQAHHFATFRHSTIGKPTLQVKLERVWTHETVLTSVKFSPDGKYLAVGLAGKGVDSQKTYIYNVTNGRKIWSVSFL
jgi:WD40 repeat protein